MAKPVKKAGKSNKVRRGTGVHAIKHANKHFSKMQKRGKLKKKIGKHKAGNNQDQNHDANEQYKDDEEEVNEDPMDMMEDDDVRYLSETAGNISFLSDKTSLHARSSVKRKKQHESSDDDEEQYERKPRTWKGDDGKRIKALLPIKGKDGIVPQFLEYTEEEFNDGDDDEDLAQDLQPDENEAVETQSLTTVVLFAKRSKKLATRKEKMAHLATKILENPQENMKSLKELRLMLDEKDRDVFVTVKKLASLSLLEVFKDIIPSYHIRVLTDTEKQQRMKKDTKQLNESEESLLRQYKAYLQRLEILIRGLRSKKDKDRNMKDSIPQAAAFGLGVVAIRCLCELLVSHPNFNYRNNIIDLIVPFMNHKIPQISDEVCKAVQLIFKQDKSGEVALQLVKCIARLLKERNCDVQPKVLNTFLSLKITQLDLKANEGGAKKKYMTRKEKMMKLSRRERKRSKHMEQLQKELQDAEVEEDSQKKNKTHTDILSQVFFAYFKILKKSTKSKLLSPVLEGLAKFAHLISVEFFHDLIAVLYSIINAAELDYRESLHVVQTVCTILTGQGESLNIDPLQFYTQLYKLLFRLHAGSPSDDVPILLTCLDLMFNKRRKQVSMQRWLAFIKRLCTLGLQLQHDGAIGVLAAVRQFMQLNRQTDILLDPDVSQGGSGVYLPELEEPEYCNANATALWELHLLRRHYHPVVRQYAGHIVQGSPILGDGQLPVELARKPPTELWDLFHSTDMQFKPPLPSPQQPKQKSKRAKASNTDGNFKSAKLNKKLDRILKSNSINVDFSILFNDKR